jgi:hypothetical protein
MGISKFDNFKELLPTDNHNKNTVETKQNNRIKTGFNCKVSSYSIQSAVSNVIRTTIHIPKRSNVLINNLRECPRSSRKKLNLARDSSLIPCPTPAVLCRGLEKSLSERHDRSTAWARHGMSESETVTLC